MAERHPGLFSEYKLDITVGIGARKTIGFECSEALSQSESIVRASKSTSRRFQMQAMFSLCTRRLHNNHFSTQLSRFLAFGGATIRLQQAAPRGHRAIRPQVARGEASSYFHYYQKRGADRSANTQQLHGKPVLGLYRHKNSSPLAIVRHEPNS